MPEDLRPPYRIQFDNARDPYTARNAIGAVDANYVTDAIATAGAGYALSANFPAGAWTAWTPTISASAGTITSSTINIARYTKAGKTITAYFDFSITNVGTGSGYLQLSLPVAASGGGGGFGREYASTGFMVIGEIAPSATLMLILTYNSSAIMATGYSFRGQLIYESA